MKSLSTIVSAVALFFAMVFGTPAFAAKYAVCVGINKYTTGASTLSGCVNDAKYFYSNLKNRGGWTTSKMTKLTDSGAKTSAIRKAIRKYAKKAKKGDTFIYMHSSHGGCNYPSYSSNPRSVFLCTYNGYYEDHQLASDLSKFKSGVKVVVVVDACHAGGLYKDGGKFDLAERVSAIMDDNRAKSLARGEKDALDKLSSSQIGWVVAADYDQTSYDGGYYDTANWMTSSSYGSVRGATFLGVFTWGWWNGKADKTGVGDKDGKMDAYEGWKYAHTWCKKNIPGHIPQYHNKKVLRRVELGKTPVKVKVTFSANGGRFSSGSTTKSKKVAKGTKVGTLWTPSKKGYKFAGWYTKKSGGKKISSSYKIYTNRKFYAHWSSGSSSSSSLSTALDTSLSFSTGGAKGWVSQTSVTWDGVDAARSGSISHSQESWMKTTVSGPGTISFRHKTSCENGNENSQYDYLEFQVDGVWRMRVYGTRDWDYDSFTVSGSGTHVLKWIYHKDGSVSSGSDCVWVDCVAWYAGRTASEKDPDEEEPELGSEEAADGEEDAVGTISVEDASGSAFFAVTASNGEDASAVADGDERTAWTTDAANGAWVVLTLAEPRTVEDVEVLGEALPDGTRILLSEDADEWEEEVPAKAQYVWVVFPECEAPLTVREIRVLPEQ